MRIAWVLYGDLAQRTGGTIYDRLVVDGLRRAGDDVRVWSLPPPPARTPLAIGTGVANGLRLGRDLRRTRPDVVVGDELCFRELAAAFPLLRRTRTRRFLLVHHLTAWEEELSPRKRWFARRAEHLAIDAADRVLTTSEATRARLLAELSGSERGGMPVIDVAIPGADRLARAPREAAADGAPTNVVFLGSVIPRKRVLELVRAFAAATATTASTTARLTLVGSTDRDAAYVGLVRRAVSAHKLDARVVLAGEAGDDGVAAHLAAADALVLPSSLEGWGIAATEAVHAGVPVVAARTPGLEEALSRCREAAVLVDSDLDLVAALRRLTTEPAFRASLRSAAEAAAPKMPTWQGCVDAFRAALLHGATAP